MAMFCFALLLMVSKKRCLAPKHANHRNLEDFLKEYTPRIVVRKFSKMSR